MPAMSRVVISVGTDHHPFDRLISWANHWLALHPQLADGCFVQSGTATVSPICPGSRLLGVDQLAVRLDSADVIVCHGGPASISEAWIRGRKPIVVPRLAQLGEHVDDHQADFCEKVAGLGNIAVAHTLPEFTGLLDAAAADPAGFRASSPSSGADEAVARLGRLVEELVSRPRRLSLIGRGRRMRHDPLAKIGDPADRGAPSPEVIPAPSTTWQPNRVTARSGLAVTVNEEQE
jgi:UDP-N-acetylglucosamine transferase subunit ALG13